MAETIKRLGAVRPSSASTWTQLYQTASGTTAVVSCLAICNQTSSAVTVRVAHEDGTTGTPANEDIFLYDETIPANTTLQLTWGITMNTDIMKFLMDYAPDASKITKGNLPIAQMPTGGTWSLSDVLKIDIGNTKDVQLYFNSSFTDQNMTLKMVHKTSGVIADRLGIGITHYIADSSNENLIGFYAFRREGADNSGRFELYTFNAGSSCRSLYISHDGKLATGGETSPDVDPGGLCLYQGTDDGNILTCKSSDVSHGVTNYAETDTYFYAKKISPLTGGVRLTGLSTGVTGAYLTGIGTDDGNTNHNSTGVGRVIVYGYKASGNSVTDADADENIFVIRTYSGGDKTLFIVDEDGDYFYDGTGTAFDEYDDAIACYDASQILARNWDNIIQYSKDKLHQMGVIEVTPKEKTAHKKHDDIFVSGKKMNMLLLGAVGELYKVCSTLCNKLGLTYSEAKKLSTQTLLGG